jgi:hypothetical protein
MHEMRLDTGFTMFRSVPILLLAIAYYATVFATRYSTHCALISPA